MPTQVQIENEIDKTRFPFMFQGVVIQMVSLRPFLTFPGCLERVHPFFKLFENPVKFQFLQKIIPFNENVVCPS